MDDKLIFQNKVLSYIVIAQVILLALLGVVMSIYINDTKDLRREMLLYARESINFEYKKLKDEKDKSLREGWEEIEQLEKLIDDYRNNSMEIDELLQGMETEINTIRWRS
jgi:uncharacterized protein YlxW (UPF0749 family)